MVVPKGGKKLLLPPDIFALFYNILYPLNQGFVCATAISALIRTLNPSANLISGPIPFEAGYPEDPLTRR